MTKILVADDSKLEREKMTDMLEKEDFSVVTAKNGKQAVEEYKKHRPDLVLLDIIMDKMNGIDALKEILKEDENANVVMVSGVGHEDTVSEALELGAQRYVIKPVLRSKIVPTVNRVLGE